MTSNTRVCDQNMIWYDFFLCMGNKLFINQK